jgi:hypothetical protein
MAGEQRSTMKAFCRYSRGEDAERIRQRSNRESSGRDTNRDHIASVDSPASTGIRSVQEART